MHVITAKGSTDFREVRRGFPLRATGARLLDFLEQDDVGIVAADFVDREIEIDGRSIGIGIVPTLAELHVELQNLERAHGSLSTTPTKDALPRRLCPHVIPEVYR